METGFLARVGCDSYKAVDRCLGPGDLWSKPLNLPWAIVDAAWAEKDPSVLDPLRGHGTKLLVDTAAWRYRFPETFEVTKMTAASWAPDRPLDLADRATMGRFVRASLWAQAKLGADAYLVPGSHPENGTEDLRPFYDEILRVIEDFSDVPTKPLVLYLGVHRRTMTKLTIEVPDDVAVRVANVADQRGLAPEMLVGQVVTETFSPGHKLGFIGLGHSGRGDLSQRLTELRHEVADESWAMSAVPRRVERKPRRGGHRRAAC